MDAVVLRDLTLVVFVGSVVRVVVRLSEGVFVEAFGAEEGFEPEAEHIEGGETGGDEADEPEEFAEAGVGLAGEGLVEDLVFGEEAGERPDAGDGEDAGGHGPEGDWDATAEASHDAHVLFSAQCMDHAAGCEEEERLEEGVGHEVEDAGPVGGDAAAEEHVAELGDGGVGEDALDVVLDDAEGGGEEGGEGSDDGDDAEGEGGAVEEGVGAGDHVDARGDHGCGVDEGGDGGGAFHGVGEPDVEGDLGGLAGGADDEEEGDGGEEATVPGRVRGDLREDFGEGEGAEVGDEKEHREKEAEVADAVDDEGFFAGVGGGVLLEVEADEEVGGEADAFPTDEQEEEARGEDEDEHEEHEEVEVGEEAPVAVFMRHVAGGVEVDEEADAGDDGEHDQREVVDGEGEGDVEAGDADPVTGRRGDGFGGSGLQHGGPEPGDEECGDEGEEQGDGGDGDARKAAAGGSVEDEAEEGKERDPPEEIWVHWGSWLDSGFSDSKREGDGIGKTDSFGDDEKRSTGNDDYEGNGDYKGNGNYRGPSLRSG